MSLATIAPGFQSVASSIREARRVAADAPFIWISGTRFPQARGNHAQTLCGDLSQVSWQWDGRRLLVESDTFGLIPAFVYRSADTLGVSDSIERLARESAQLTIDDAALAVFLRLGFFIGNDTPFREIHTVPPSARVEWTGGDLSIDRARLAPAETITDRDNAIEHAIQLTRAAVERRLPRAPFAVPLSGGRDSRHILLQLLACGARPEFTVTTPRYPPTPAEDPRVASLVAATAGVRHVLPRRRACPSALEARKNIETSYCADEHAWFYPMLDYVRGGVAVVYEGIGGSLWTTGWLPEQENRQRWRAGDVEAIAERMIDRYAVVDEKVLDDVLAEPERYSRRIAIERLATELGFHADAPDPGKSFHFWNRLRRELALVPFGLMRRFATVRTPLVDRDLAEFLLSLEPETISPALSRADRSFHADAVRRAFPRFADLAFEDETAPPLNPRAHNASFVRGIAAHLLASPAPHRLLHSTHVWPRLAYAMVRRDYAASIPWLASLSLYLSQLEELISR